MSVQSENKVFDETNAQFLTELLQEKGKGKTM